MSSTTSSEVDLISITDLSLRTPNLPSDLWQRPSKSQPLLLSLSIRTSISSEASTDSLLSDSLNYGTVTKTIERTVANFAQREGEETEWSLEVLAEIIASSIINQANAPNVLLYLCQPRALLGAESVGIEIFRARTDYLPGTLGLKDKSENYEEDRFIVKELGRNIIIGINQCERVDEQEVLVDLGFGINSTQEISMMRGNPLKTSRREWTGWRNVIKAVQSHLDTSKPLTIEALCTDLSRIILQPPPSSTSSSSSSSPSPTYFNVPRTTVKISKPSALMFAKYPSVEVTRQRSDFYDSLGRPRVGTSSPPPSVNVGSIAGISTSTTSKMVTNDVGGGDHVVYLGIGTNLGDRVGNIHRALRELELELDEEEEGKTKVLDTSFLYESEAMYVEDQANFLNCVIKISTTLSPLPLLSFLKEIENKLGRKKTIRNGPRVIDLDILYYDDLVMDSRAVEEGKGDEERWLKIPHQSIQEREFVLRPLNDLIPFHQHPLLLSTTSKLLSTLLSKTPTTLHRVLPLSPTKTHHLNSSTLLMSILNTTPDSFSDGSLNSSLSSALSSAHNHISNGCDILDIGGYSTRPGAKIISEEEEIRRVVPLIKKLREEEGVKCVISVDTFRSGVAKKAVEVGADIINDVFGGKGVGMLEMMASLDVPIILMHSRSRGEGDVVGGEEERDYGMYEGGVVEGVRRELGGRVQEALKKGVRRWNIVVDPGIGFAKTIEGNLEILRRLPEVLGRHSASTSSSTSTSSSSSSAATKGTPDDPSFLSDFPCLVGLSRKKFLGTLTGREVPSARDWATAAGVSCSIAGGADLVRVHDTREMMDVVKVADGIYRRG